MLAKVVGIGSLVGALLALAASIVAEAKGLDRLSYGLVIFGIIVLVGAKLFDWIAERRKSG